ncbi:MAG TPA: PepSY-associated TM helix domain-containing protein [Methylocella sp.]|nr:PepSY-associated TM helix domain-containing protein [Methylocella sp.]
MINSQSSLDGEKSYRASVTFDADTGTLFKAAWPGRPSEKTGEVVTLWLYWLHMAYVFGLPMQIFVCIMGRVMTTLSITGGSPQRGRCLRHSATASSAATPECALENIRAFRRHRYPIPVCPRRHRS